MAAFGCTSIVDEWLPGEPIPDGALLLSNCWVEPGSVPGLRVLSFDEAVALVEGVSHE